MEKKLSYQEPLFWAWWLGRVPPGTHTFQLAKPKLCSSPAQLSECPPGVWSFAGCRSVASGLRRNWQARHEPWTHHRSPAGGRRVQPKSCREASFPRGRQAPSSALSNILKPLVKGRSISHVSLACGIKSSERTLLIHHQRMGTGIPEQLSLCCHSLLGKKQQPLGISKDVACCQRPGSGG